MCAFFLNFAVVMVDKLHCIVLKTVKYGDSKLIVDILSRERGRASVVWRTPKNGRGKVNRNIFQPLTICELTVDQAKAQMLPLVRDGQIAVPYSTLTTDPVKTSVAFFVAEFLSMVSQTEQQDETFYDFVRRILIWYDLSVAMSANFHLMFLVRVSRFLGFYPNMESYAEGAVFDLRAAEFSMSLPSHKDYIPATEAAHLQLLMRMTPSNMHLYRFNRDERNRAVEAMLKFYSLHVPGFRPMRSWDVLKAIFR